MASICTYSAGREKAFHACYGDPPDMLNTCGGGELRRSTQLAVPQVLPVFALVRSELVRTVEIRGKGIGANEIRGSIASRFQIARFLRNRKRVAAGGCKRRRLKRTGRAAAVFPPFPQSARTGPKER